MSSMQSALLPLFNIFKQPDVAVSIAAGMIAIALIILVWFCIKHMVPMLRILS